MSETGRSSVTCLFLALTASAMPGLAFAENDAGPARTLPPNAGADDTITVRIDLKTPAGTAVIGAEDAPPAGWPTSNISDGGSWDAENERIKWGLFFEPSIPAFVTYNVTIPQGTLGNYCFNGIVLFDGNTVNIAGDQCVPVAVPAANTWAALILALLLVTAATSAIKTKNPPLPSAR